MLAGCLFQSWRRRFTNALQFDRAAAPRLRTVWPVLTRMSEWDWARGAPRQWEGAIRLTTNECTVCASPQSPGSVPIRCSTGYRSPEEGHRELRTRCGHRRQQSNWREKTASGPGRPVALSVGRRVVSGSAALTLRKRAPALVTGGQASCGPA
jgi:hypothetical protein